MTVNNAEKGMLLIAEPSIIGDISFNRSIILLAAHDEEGSIGFILNKPLAINLSEIIPEINVNFPVFNGGPVEQDNLFFIHQIPHLIPNSIEISNGVYWGGSFETITKLINSEQIAPEEIRFFLGYSGWDYKQLDGELQDKSWLVLPNTYKNQIIEKGNPQFWKEKMIELGGDYQIWSNAPENPMYN